MIDMAERYGAVVARIDAPWGTVFTHGQIESAIKQHRPSIVAIVHAETSTGACQPLEGLAQIVHDAGALLLVDTVTSIGGVPLHVDKWGIDASYAGGQKCLACPPGLAPLTFSPRAMEKLRARPDKVPNWYLDMSAIAKYLVPGKGAAKRVYHHTAPISMCYAFKEALQIVCDEGLEEAWQRHRRNAERLWSGLEAMGLKMVVDKDHRLPSLTTVYIPEGVDGAAVCANMLKRYNIELGGGLGAFAGKVMCAFHTPLNRQRLGESG